MYQVNLQWKPYQVKLDRMHKYLKDNCNNYDGMIASEESLIVMLTFGNQADIILIHDYWGDLTKESQEAMSEEETREYLRNVIADSMHFGNKIMIEYAAENVMMGITQAGKTKVVADYLADIMRYLTSGSLYEVIGEIDRLVDEGVPQDLAPFVTEARLGVFKAKIQDYLS